MKVSVILPAAGLGTRMGREKAGTSRKQFMLLEGAPILVHTIRKFAHCPSVTEIVVALRGEDLDWARGLIQQQHLEQAGAIRGGRRQPPAIGRECAGVARRRIRIWWRCTMRCGPSSIPSWWRK